MIARAIMVSILVSLVTSAPGALGQAESQRSQFPNKLASADTAPKPAQSINRAEPTIDRRPKTGETITNYPIHVHSKSNQL